MRHREFPVVYEWAFNRYDGIFYFKTKTGKYVAVSSAVAVPALLLLFTQMNAYL